MLYNTYRPQNFSEVAGQEETLLTLKKQVSSKKFSSSYLLTGHRGTGKTTIARILARSICCQNPCDDGPCNNCPSCTAILNNATYDYCELDAASNNSISDIKELVASTSYVPTTLDKKIYVIDEVHNLSGSAFDALLKTIEEPPSYCVFILCTTELHKIPPTIKSRCSIYRFSALSLESIHDRLIYVLRDMNKDYEDDAVNLIAKQADGALRDALSILEKLSIQADCLTVEQVRKSLCLMDDEVTLRLLHMLLNADAAAGLTMLQNLFEEGRSLHLLIDNLIQALVAAIVLRSSGGAARLYSNEAYITELGEITRNADLEALFELTDRFSGMKEQIRNALNPYVDIQLCLIKCCSCKKKETEQNLSSLQIRINEMQKEIQSLKAAITNYNEPISNIGENESEKTQGQEGDDGFRDLEDGGYIPFGELADVKDMIDQEEPESADQREEEHTSLENLDIMNIMGNFL